MENTRAQPSTCPPLWDTIKTWLPEIRVFVFSLIGAIIIVILIHNAYSPPEQDISQDKIHSLLKVLPILLPVAGWENGPMAQLNLTPENSTVHSTPFIMTQMMPEVMAG